MYITNFWFWSSLFWIWILILYLICRSCLNRYNSKILSRSYQLDSNEFQILFERVFSTHQHSLQCGWQPCLKVSKPNFLKWIKKKLFQFRFKIGHLKSSDERTIVSPKFVTSLTDKRIRDVSTSDAAIVVMLESGDVIALNDFATRRIMSTKQFDVVKMVATGGHLDSRVVPNTDLVSWPDFYAFRHTQLPRTASNRMTV